MECFVLVEPKELFPDRGGCLGHVGEGIEKPAISRFFLRRSRPVVNHRLERDIEIDPQAVTVFFRYVIKIQ